MWTVDVSTARKLSHRFVLLLLLLVLRRLASSLMVHYRHRLLCGSKKAYILHPLYIYIYM